MVRTRDLILWPCLLGAGVGMALAVAGCGNGSVAAKVSTAASTRLTVPSTVTEVTTVDQPVVVSTTETVATTIVRPTTTLVTPTTVTTSTTVIAPVTVTTTATLAVTTTEAVEPVANEDTTPAWVWVLLLVLLGGLVALIAWLVTRRRGPSALSPERRQQALFAAVGTWTARGWTVESETPTSAVLVRDDERMLVTVDERGNVSSTTSAG